MGTESGLDFLLFHCSKLKPKVVYNLKENRLNNRLPLFLGKILPCLCSLILPAARSTTGFSNVT